MNDAVGEVEDWRLFAPLDLDRCLSAAIREFQEGGYRDATLGSVAARAGLPPENVRARYRDTHAMLYDALLALLDDLRWRTAAALRGVDGTLRQFERVVECVATHHCQHPELSHLLQFEVHSLRPRAREHVLAASVAEQRTVDAVIHQGVAEGLFTTRTPSEAGRAVMSMVMGLSNRLDPAGSDAVHGQALLQVRFALALVGHRSPLSDEARPGARRR